MARFDSDRRGVAAFEERPKRRWQKVDYALLNVGLNAKPCGRGFGATLCGEDLERYNREAAEPAQHARRDFEQPVSDPEDDLGFRR